MLILFHEEKFTSILLLFSIIGVAWSQSEYQPYSYQFYQKLKGSFIQQKPVSILR